ncbi:MAG: D-alanyl-D-alanine carboxypeptidase/D-alanyl-D-alanine-endopeptidase, partial [Pseudomonadota bacterium]
PVTALSPAFASAPERSLFPAPRPDGLWRRAAPSAQDLIDAAAMGGRVCFAVADAWTGEFLDLRDALVGMPPASVAKAVTCAYGLDRLGPAYRFRTQVFADGTLRNGRLEGDLWLVGSGDPTLLTDDLHALAGQLQAAGLREVTGRLKLATAALPHIRAIDPAQPVQVGYNPSVGALNLNFNRVHFEWERQGQGYDVRMDARSESIRPAVTVQRMRVEDRGGPVYTYAEENGQELWTVARSALGGEGSRWLPVRRSADYTAEVFQILCRSRGIVLDGPDAAEQRPEGAVLLAEHQSVHLEDILRGMMRWSTNITAEAVGLSATAQGGTGAEDLAGSAAAMSDWMRARLGARNPHFIDHSGLGDRSRVRASDMVTALVAAGAQGRLRDLMKTVPMRDTNGRLVADHPISVVAKTGTLNFVSSLAGYATTPEGRDLAFAIFCADMPRREALRPDQMERPDGGRSYARRARALQQSLIESWAMRYGA